MFCDSLYILPIQKICGWKEMWKAILALSFAVGVFIIVVE